MSKGLVHHLREACYKAVPSAVRRALRGKRRELIFDEALARLLANPADCADPASPVLTDLIYGWSNEAWSAREEFLAACIGQALITSGPILECGSGLSSIVLGAIATNRKLPHWILEHKPTWATKVQEVTQQHGLKSVFCTRPLKDYGDFHWYDLSLEQLPESFSLVICDGPPSRTKGGRYGLSPVLQSRLKSGTVILLDDAYRKEEIEIAKRWEIELKATFSVKGSVKPYAQILLI